MNDNQVAPEASTALPTLANSFAIAVVPPSMSKIGTCIPRSMLVTSQRSPDAIPAGSNSTDGSGTANARDDVVEAQRYERQVLARVPPGRPSHSEPTASSPDLCSR